MQSFDKRFLSQSGVWMVLAGLALLGLALPGCGSNPFAAKEEYVRRGRQFAEKGSFADAVLQYRKALQKDASYGEAYLRYGQVLVRLNKPAEAFQALSRAVDLMPASEEAKIELGNLAINGLLASPSRPPKYYESAQKISRELLDRNPNSFDGLRLKGLLALVDRHPQEAVDTLRKAWQAKPDNAGVVTLLLEAMLSQGQTADAEGIARKALATNPHYGPLYDILYGYYVSANRMAEAEQVVKAKIANNPKEPLFVIQLADHYSKLQKTDKVDALLNDFISKPQEFPHATLDAGDFYARTGRLDQALRLYQRGLESDKNNRKDYFKRIVAARIKQGRFDDAKATSDLLLKEFPGDLDALASRADLRMATGDPAEIRKAVEEFGILVGKSPDNNELRFNLAHALRESGDEAKALTVLAELLRRDPNHKNGLREMADLKIRAQSPDEALQYAERLLALDPGNVGARLVRTAAWALRGRFNEVRSELRRITNERPDLQEPVLQMATLEMEVGNYPEAERLYLRLRGVAKTDIRPLRGLVKVYQSQGQPRKALELMQQEAKRTGDVQVRNLLASAAAQAGDLDLALATAQSIAADRPQDAAEFDFIGQLQQQKGELNQAIASYDKARQLAPKDAVVLARWGLALMEAGRKAEGLAALRDSVKLQPDMPVLMNNLAWHLAESGSNLEEAQSLAQKAVQKEPANSTYSDTLAMVYLRAGKTEDALQVLQGVVRKDPASPTYRLHLAQTLIAAGQRQKARIELDAATRNRPSPAENVEIQKLLTTLVN